MWHAILFWCFATLTVLAAFFVISSRNSVRAVLCLVLTFIGASGMWLLLQAEFLALVLVMVYVGAVMVLFLFVVMMLDLNSAPAKEGFLEHGILAFAIAALAIGQIAWILNNDRFSLAHYPEPPARAADYSNVQAIGSVLYTDHVLAFETAGVLLLVAMISAVALTFRGVKARKKQSPGLQAQVRAQDRLKIIKMPVEKRVEE